MVKIASEDMVTVSGAWIVVVIGQLSNDLLSLPRHIEGHIFKLLLQLSGGICD